MLYNITHYLHTHTCLSTKLRDVRIFAYFMRIRVGTIFFFSNLILQVFVNIVVNFSKKIVSLYNFKRLNQLTSCNNTNKSCALIGEFLAKVFIYYLEEWIWNLHMVISKTFMLKKFCNLQFQFKTSFMSKNMKRFFLKIKISRKWTTLINMQFRGARIDDHMVPMYVKNF